MIIPDSSQIPTYHSTPPYPTPPFPTQPLYTISHLPYIASSNTPPINSADPILNTTPQTHPSTPFLNSIPQHHPSTTPHNCTFNPIPQLHPSTPPSTPFLNSTPQLHLKPHSSTPSINSTPQLHLQPHSSTLPHNPPIKSPHSTPQLPPPPVSAHFICISGYVESIDQDLSTRYVSTPCHHAECAAFTCKS